MAAKAELDRDFDQLKEQPIALYYMSYEIIDSMSDNLSSAFGALIRSASGHSCVAHIDVRVGEHARQYTRGSRQSTWWYDRKAGSGHTLPIDDDQLALRSALWIETDKIYKRALVPKCSSMT